LVITKNVDHHSDMDVTWQLQINATKANKILHNFLSPTTVVRNIGEARKVIRVSVEPLTGTVSVLLSMKFSR
jgi:hypothetical protein